jgi:Zn-dependent peptidase ImmA (M78 family)
MRLRREEVAAVELLQRAGAKHLPIDVEDIATRHLGLNIVEEDLDDDVSGALYRADGRAVIAVNRTHHPNRQRFTVAHELGHYILHEGQPVFIDRFARLNLRDTTSSLAIHPEEIQANRFAAELLMPRELLLSELRERLGRDRADIVLELAQRFGVSTRAMELRLTNLGVMQPEDDPAPR